MLYNLIKGAIKEDSNICFSNINFILDGCIKCGKPIINYSLEEQSIDGCSYCLNKSFYFDKVISCVEYTEISKKIVFGLKYNNKTYLSKYIATIMKEKLDLENIKFDYILFVPLHKKRLRQRGFNQAEKIAMDLSKIVDIPTVDNTKRLYKLGKEERINELKNAFVIKENIIDLKNKNVLLVDDIFTTGSTVNEISKILKINGVNKVFVSTFLTRTDTFYVKA